MADWKEEGNSNLHSTCLISRGGYDTNYDPDARATAREHEGLPPLQKPQGRRTIRTTRKLACKLQQPFQDCLGLQEKSNRSCKLSCYEQITLERRQEMRNAYNLLRSDLNVNAKLRAYRFLFSLIKTERVRNEGMTRSYYLHSGQGSVKVCRDFWSLTFGLHCRVVRQLTKLSLTHFEVCTSLGSIHCVALFSDALFPIAGSQRLLQI